MSIVASVKDGKIVESASQNSLKKATGPNSGMDKESFLQLLVAQMKYQDPLEPTSNTEYISQYAQFSQVEEMQNMATSMDLQRGSGLVGQEVYIKTTAANGETKYVQGKVDYVVYENNKAFLSIDENLYSLDDLDTVVDATYMAAYNKASEFMGKLSKLPALGLLSVSDLEDVTELAEMYADFDDYEKSFISNEDVAKLLNYTTKMNEIRTLSGS